MPRRSLFALSIVVLFVFASCRSSMQVRDATNVCATGSHGNPDRYSPLVCVEAINGVAKPKIEPVHVFAHDKKNGTTAIHWKTPSDMADLKVEMKDKDNQTCVTQVHCTPNGNLCVATMNPKAADDTKCPYKLWIEGQTQPEDPVIIIDQCCTR